MTNAKSVILVHGAWSHGSSWSKVIPLPSSRGVAVTAIQMPLTGFVDDAACLRRARVEGPVVLAGHPYGGAVIPEAGTDEKVSALVYIAAFAPDAGESARPSSESAPPPLMVPEVRPDADGFLTISDHGIRTGFAQDLTNLEQEILFAAQGPTVIASLGGAVTSPAWKAKPTRYMVASEDHAIQPELERTMARRMQATSVEVAASYVAMLAVPEATAELIGRAL